MSETGRSLCRLYGDYTLYVKTVQQFLGCLKITHTRLLLSFKNYSLQFPGCDDPCMRKLLKFPILQRMPMQSISREMTCEIT